MRLSLAAFAQQQVRPAPDPRSDEPISPKIGVDQAGQGKEIRPVGEKEEGGRSRAAPSVVGGNVSRSPRWAADSQRGDGHSVARHVRKAFVVRGNLALEPTEQLIGGIAEPVSSVVWHPERALGIARPRMAAAQHTRQFRVVLHLVHLAIHF